MNKVDALKRLTYSTNTDNELKYIKLIPTLPCQDVSVYSGDLLLLFLGFEYGYIG